MIAYHFTSDTLRDGSPIPAIGEWLKHEGKIIPCVSGLHASEHPFDALQYAPGNFLHLVELKGDKKRKIKKHGDPCDKIVGCQRKILATIDVTELLKQFARGCALDVIHLWDAPQIVIDYLKTGNESLRDAARDAARAAAWTAAWTAWAAAPAAAPAAAQAAARTAAQAAAQVAVQDAARAAAWTAARAAAWDTARDAARDAAWAAAQAAVQDAAWTTAWDTAREAAWAAARTAAQAAVQDTAWAAVRAAQQQKFQSMADIALQKDYVLSLLK